MTDRVTMNNWKKIWEARNVDEQILGNGNDEQIFLELKRSNGFDIVDNGLAYSIWKTQYQQIKDFLEEDSENGKAIILNSVYEVGCGSGANLYLFEKDGIKCGGMDYSCALIEIAHRVLKSKDIECAEASLLKTEPLYDAVFANSVFPYFDNEQYALEVLNQMLAKTNFSIGIIDVHDKEKEEAFLQYRKSIIEDYEERYKNLPKLFYNKQFFINFAEKNKLEIKFVTSTVKGYWNNEFVYNCYMYK